MIASLAFAGFLAGAVLGSFASASSMAWIEKRPIFRKRSICDHCGKALSSLQLVPVCSYLVLRAKCGYCGGRIPAFHFYLELVSSLLCALFAVCYGLQWLTVFYMIAGTAMVAASSIDIKTHLLPDIVTIGCLALLPPIIALDDRLTLMDAVLGYVWGGGIPLSLYLLFRVVRKKDCLGFGDIKLFAFGGALAGWHALPFVLFFSSITGIVVFAIIGLFAEKKDLWELELPFGPFICAAVLAVLLMPDLPGMAYNVVCGY